ncbi:Bax inhibitor-1/YccA family protein [Candidatus Protochlamydia phocaeensis]|uniref:Bax inhibitor-1/YccA family protein n=1 Tax=Candidatus Protochlamydia phocaeensis TaxID=1414722 RepID=UPI0008380A56|nr:Bax inhibitor-1/YccA family protein [Candidatus Protochlamydia phocaeensis]
MRSSNPALLSNPFSGFGLVSESNAMTIRGTVYKTLALLVLVLLPAAWVWRMFYTAGQNPAAIQTWMYVGLIGGFIASLATVFKKNWAPLTAPLYAVLEGLFLGGISSMFEKAYPGIVMQAVSLSIATLLVMLVAYQSGWIQPSENFKLGVVAATGGIALVYFVAIILGFFGINVAFINGSGLFSILFSVFVVIIAALNFIIDFDFIEQGARAGVPKYMEWYGAFALMVTLVWLYIEILRLLAKLNERK